MLPEVFYGPTWGGFSLNPSMNVWLSLKEMTSTTIVVGNTFFPTSFASNDLVFLYAGLRGCHHIFHSKITASTASGMQSLIFSTSITVGIKCSSGHFGQRQNVRDCMLRTLTEFPIFTVPMALLTGFVIPPLVGALWGDKLGSFIWGSLVARLMSEFFSPP